MIILRCHYITYVYECNCRLKGHFVQCATHIESNARCRRLGATQVETVESYCYKHTVCSNVTVAVKEAPWHIDGVHKAGDGSGSSGHT